MESSAPQPPDQLRVACAQLTNSVGDLQGNAARIREAMDWAEGEGADVLVLPELALTGYPLEDLSLRDDFVTQTMETLDELATHSGSCVTIVGTLGKVEPRRDWDTVTRTSTIAAAVLCDGQLRGRYDKCLLPTYDLFSEARTFAPGNEPGRLWRIGGVVAGICICEDLWSGDGPPEQQAAGGAQILLVPNGSPYYRDKRMSRSQTASEVARRNGVPVVYVNCVGGVDELVFDGGCIVADPDGSIRYLGQQFEPHNFWLDIPVAAPRPVTGGPLTTVHARIQAPRPTPPTTVEHAPQYEAMEEIWRVLGIGVRDFAHANGYKKAILGVSGGIDAAVAATVAVDALGADCVIGVYMPAPDDSAEEEAERAGVQRLSDLVGLELVTRPLGPVAPELEGAADQVGDVPSGDALEELYARARGAVLRTMAEASDAMVLATGNKSELSIGAGILGGDMTGDFAPLRDCPKTLLWELARWRNQSPDDEEIPEEALDRTPTIRSRSDLTLPSYRVLDEIVERFIELGEGVEEIEAAGFERKVVENVIDLIIGAERKRRLVAPGVKITARAWGKDLHMPVTNGWRPFG
jgi:NAD+ synthase (glutamine-hydrolysing)